MAIELPPDGRQVAGRRIEGFTWALEEEVTAYLNMLSVADRPAGEAKVRATFAAHPVLSRVLELPYADPAPKSPR